MQGKYWESIEIMPLYNWHKCMEGELQYVQKELSLEFTEKDKVEFEVAFEKLYTEFSDFKGVAKSKQKIFNAIKKKALLECDYLRTGNRMNITLIEIEEQKIKTIQEEQTESSQFSIEKSLVVLSKWLGYRLDWKQVSVKEFYIIIEEYGKQDN